MSLIRSLGMSRLLLFCGGLLLLVSNLHNLSLMSNGGEPTLGLWFIAKAVFALGLILLIALPSQARK